MDATQQKAAPDAIDLANIRLHLGAYEQTLVAMSNSLLGCYRLLVDREAWRSPQLLRIGMSILGAAIDIRWLSKHLDGVFGGCDEIPNGRSDADPIVAGLAAGLAVEAPR